MESPFYKKILLKLSGEALMGDQEFGISSDVITSYAKQIKEIVDLGVEVSIVIGGGNIFRGLSGAAQGVDRVTGDHMGMLATVINSLALPALIAVNFSFTASIVFNIFSSHSLTILSLAILIQLLLKINLLQQ